jgi:hypothetical protein
MVLEPDESVRLSTPSIPTDSVVAVPPPVTLSFTAFKPLYWKLVVVPLTALLDRLPTASYWKVADNPGPLIPTS